MCVFSSKLGLCVARTHTHVNTARARIRHRPSDLRGNFISGRLLPSNYYSQQYLTALESLPQSLKRMKNNGHLETFRGHFRTFWSVSTTFSHIF